MMDSRVVSEVGVAQRRLPRLVAFSAFLVYLFTLQRSATSESIAVLAKSAGWDWHPNVVAPLHVLLTFPIRWLPATAQLVCLNLTAALFAGLTLGFLARSVSLLPYDRTRLQRYIENRFGSLADLRSAWLPPVVAAMICGFQLSFWENAIVATGEMLDLLLFAWLVNGLLEFRADRRESRLLRWAFVYGLALANNFAMIGFFPAFLVALVWIKGSSFFGLRFLARMTTGGGVGLLILLMPPLLHLLSNPAGHGFGEMVSGYFGYQKNSLVSFPRYVVLLCSLTSVFPMLFIGIRWPSHFGEISALGVKLTNYGVHLIHFTLLIACIWVSFDPAFSPRSLVRGMSAMLPFYYLGSLAIGYGIGYLLLVFCAAIIGTEERASRLGWVAANAAVILVWAVAVAVPVGLIVKNLPLIRASRPVMEELARAAARSFPAEGAVALSDDPYLLYSVQRELLKMNPNHRNILVDTTSLSVPEYHYFLQTRHHGRWPGFVNQPSKNAPIDPMNLVNMILQIREGTPIYYLHPSYGYYFEFLYSKPHQALYELLPYPTNSLSGPVLAKGEIESQDSYWNALMAGELRTLVDQRTPVANAGQTRLPRRDLGRVATEIASRALNDFGVSVQRSGDLDRAAKYFDLAARVNPDNLAATINRAYNVRLRSGENAEMEMTDETVRRLQSFGGRWDRLIGENGPVDEPLSCYRLAQAFSSGNNLRQAGQQLERTVHFSPDNRSARLDYLMMCVRVRLADRALEGVSNYRDRFGGTGIKTEEEMELLRVEAWAKVIQNKPAEAEKILVDAQARHPGQSLPWETLVEIHLQFGRETNALEVLKRQIEVQPRNVKALVNYGGIKLRTGDYEGALPFLDLALQQKPDDENGLFNRALACSATRRFESASRDFLALLAGGTVTYRLQASFGLAEVYFRMNRREESLRYYREFLKLAGHRVQEANVARERIKLLETTKGKLPRQDG